MSRYYKYIIILLTVIVMICSVSQCYHYKHEYQIASQNISAMTDTLSHIVTSRNEYVYSNSILLSDLKTLKLLNDSLYLRINSLKREAHIKGDIVSGSVIKSDVVYKTIKDTVYWNNTKDTISSVFNFNDLYRLLEGELLYIPKLDSSHIQVSIKKDITYVNYTILTDSSNRIYVKSDNPYVSVKELNSFVLPKQKPKKWGVGLQVGYGISTNNMKVSPYIGIGIQYNIFTF